MGCWQARNLAGMGLLMLTLQVGAQAIDSTDVDDRRKKLIEQKYRLVDSLVNASAKQGRETEAAAQVIEVRKLLERAREAISGNFLDRASLALDEALRGVSKSSAQLARQKAAATSGADEGNYRNLSEQVTTYRSALDDLVKSGGQVASQARGVGRQVDALQAEAGNLATSGRFGEASRKLTDAYKLAVESLSELRAGQTVTLSLKFDTPADEFNYELKRFGSGGMMVSMLLAEGRGEGERRLQIDLFVREGKRLNDEAAAMAAAGKHKDAIPVMEKATVQMNRALQMMGIPVF